MGGGNISTQWLVESLVHNWMNNLSLGCLVYFRCSLHSLSFYDSNRAEPGEIALGRTERPIGFHSLIWYLIGVVFYRSNIHFCRILFTVLQITPIYLQTGAEMASSVCNFINKGRHFIIWKVTKDLCSKIWPLWNTRVKYSTNFYLLFAWIAPGVYSNRSVPWKPSELDIHWIQFLPLDSLQ